MQTSHAMPSYNPNVAPFALDYNSAAADPLPVFLVRYQLDPSQSLPAEVTAQLTLTDQDDNTVYTGPAASYDTSALNPGDWMQMALQVNPAGLATGRYNWQVSVSASDQNASYSGAFDFLSGSAAANNLTSTPLGPGWSPDNLYRLWPVQGGVIVQNPDNTSLWFAQNGAGSFTTPAGDFSTLSYDPDTATYTRTLPDGTQYLFSSAGQQASIVDRNGNTTSYAWNSSNELTSITDMNGQVVTLNYNVSGYLLSAVDPANRTLALGYSAPNQLITLTDPDGTVWNYAYTTANQLTSVGDPTALKYDPTTGLISTITLPTGAIESLTPVQAQGLSSGSNGTPAMTLGGATADYTDSNGNLYWVATDGLGFGQVQQSISPTGSTNLNDFNANGQAWLIGDANGKPTATIFNSQGKPRQIVCASIYGDDG